MRARILALSLLLPVLATACSSRQDAPVIAGSAGPSYVSGVSAEDARALAGDVVNLTTQRLPASAGAVHVVLAEGDAVLGPAISDGLQRAGYSMAPAGQARHQISYSAAPLVGGVVLRVQTPTTRAARLYRRAAAGPLLAAGPFSVTETPR